MRWIQIPEAKWLKWNKIARLQRKSWKRQKDRSQSRQKTLAAPVWALSALATPTSTLEPCLIIWLIFALLRCYHELYVTLLIALRAMACIELRCKRMKSKYAAKLFLKELVKWTALIVSPWYWQVRKFRGKRLKPSLESWIAYWESLWLSAVRAVKVMETAFQMCGHHALKSGLDFLGLPICLNGNSEHRFLCCIRGFRDSEQNSHQMSLLNTEMDFAVRTVASLYISYARYVFIPWLCLIINFPFENFCANMLGRNSHSKTSCSVFV